MCVILEYLNFSNYFYLINRNHTLQGFLTLPFKKEYIIKILKHLKKLWYSIFGDTEYEA
jgi:hypothetical protein